MAFSQSDAPPAVPIQLDKDLRGYLETNKDLVTRITKPVSIVDIGALSAQSDYPIVFDNIIEYPDFRICDILVKNRTSQARALGVGREELLNALFQRWPAIGRQAHKT